MYTHLRSHTCTCSPRIIPIHPLKHTLLQTHNWVTHSSHIHPLIHNYSHTDALTHKFLYKHIIIYTCAQHGYTQQPHILVHPHWTQDCIHMCSHTCTHTPSHRYYHTRAHTTVSPQKGKSLRKIPSRNVSADVHPDLVQG